MLKKPPRVRDNNGALQVRLRMDGRDHFIYRIVRFDDPVTQVRGAGLLCRDLAGCPARGFDQAKTKATSIRKQRGLGFDDVSFMTSRRFYGKTTPATSTGRRIEYSPRYNPSKRERFRGVWPPDGSYADLD